MCFEFGEFVLDTDARVLRRGTSPVRLSPKAYHLLEVLIAARPRAIGKQELMDAIWPGIFVDEGILTVHVAALRRVLGDTRQSSASSRRCRGGAIDSSERLGTW